MFAFAFASDPRDENSLSDLVGTMLAAWPYAPAETVSSVQTPRASAALMRWPVTARDRAAAPIWDERTGRLFVGDVRLYNRAELNDALGIASEGVSDSELAWRAYERWGDDLVAHLAGDFAFVIWNGRDRSILAVRDHLGVRPLYFRVEPDRILVASEIVQVLAAAGRPVEIDAQSVADAFVRVARSRHRTYFEGIRALPPGHVLKIDKTGLHERQYWRPQVGSVAPLRYEEHCARVREAFIESVRARLESSKPIIAHSSGGFDSSSILMVAADVYRKEPLRPPLFMASATTPGMECDDAAFMDAVAGSVPFEGIRWNVLESPGYGLYDQSLGIPGVRKGIGGAEQRDLLLARDRGAGVLLGGVLGDTVLHANGVTRDMIRGGRWADVLRFTVGNSRSPAPLKLLAKSLLGYLSPDLALRVLAVRDNRSLLWPPRWMGPRLRELFPLSFPERETIGSTSHVVADLWSRVTSAAVSQVVSVSVAYGAEQGLESRLPFADHRLIEAILEVPWELRIPNGDARRLGRDALGDLLPRVFVTRRNQGNWMPVFARQARALRPAILGLLTDSEWLSAPYLEQNAAREMYARTEDANRESAEDVILLTAIGSFEAWLRLLRKAGYCAI